LDAAVLRRASIVEAFVRPSDEERRELFAKDLCDMGVSAAEVAKVVKATAAKDSKSAWTYSDIHTRLYPAAVSLAFPDSPLKVEHFHQAALDFQPLPVMAG
jgi:hypothetical protein